ncbi:SAM-dependent methyltransferase, partial [Nocardioides hankookensis]
MDLDAFRWLLTDDGQRLLAAATEAGDDSLATQTRLRRKAEPAQVATAVTQATLRVKARAKFGELADRMYFTSEGLEQA